VPNNVDVAAQVVHLVREGQRKLDMAEVFSRTKPKLAVYSHIVLPTATEQDLIPPTRKTYSGPLELGEDLMVIEVGEKVEVRRPTKP